MREAAGTTGMEGARRSERTSRGSARVSMSSSFISTSCTFSMRFRSISMRMPTSEEERRGFLGGREEVLV